MTYTIMQIGCLLIAGVAMVVTLIAASEPPTGINKMLGVFVALIVLFFGAVGATTLQPYVEQERAAIEGK